eukprot:798641-Prorocentrum_minimum.AAC.1
MARMRSTPRRPPCPKDDVSAGGRREAKRDTRLADTLGGKKYTDYAIVLYYYVFLLADPGGEGSTSGDSSVKETNNSINRFAALRIASCGVILEYYSGGYIEHSMTPPRTTTPAAIAPAIARIGGFGYVGLTAET